MSCTETIYLEVCLQQSSCSLGYDLFSDYSHLDSESPVLATNRIDSFSCIRDVVKSTQSLHEAIETVDVFFLVGLELCSVALWIFAGVTRHVEHSSLEEVVKGAGRLGTELFVGHILIDEDVKGCSLFGGISR